MSGDDINGDAIGILLSCSDSSDIKQIYPLQEIYMTKNFKNKKDIDIFLEQLRDFYIDSKADEFFEQNSKTYEKVSDYINTTIGETSIIKILEETEGYVRNQNKYYPDRSISYKTIVTLFRPSIASFYRIITEDHAILISFQSPNDYSKNPEQLDIRVAMNTAVHEFLHNYINAPVENNNHLIKNLTSHKDKMDYAHPMYVSMSWNRIVDENFVRAVQGRIYKRIFGEEKALEEIIEPQIEYGEFKNLKSIYMKLGEYEDNSRKYNTIDYFIPLLIEELFRQ